MASKRQKQIMEQKLVEMAKMALDNGNTVIYPAPVSYNIIPGLIKQMGRRFPGLTWRWEPEQLLLFITPKTEIAK